jgi:hypothetical protein
MHPFLGRPSRGITIPMGGQPTQLVPDTGTPSSCTLVALKSVGVCIVGGWVSMGMGKGGAVVCGWVGEGWGASYAGPAWTLRQSYLSHVSSTFFRTMHVRYKCSVLITACKYRFLS